MKYKEIAVISDIHSNAMSLEIVLKEILSKKIDLCIILGDLLTYGTQPNEVIELLFDFSNKINCIFIKGNHDQFYFDIQKKIDPIKYNIAEFVKESIFWTNDKLKYNLYEVFDWKDNFILDKVYFAHANPFEYGNWKYLNDEKDILKAAGYLGKKGVKVGIFGHTHRNRKYIIEENSVNCISSVINEFKFNDNRKLILNAGSIGQPRGSSPNYTTLKISNNSIICEDRNVVFDNKAVVKQIYSATLSIETKNELSSFWGIN